MNYFDVVRAGVRWAALATACLAAAAACKKEAPPAAPTLPPGPALLAPPPQVEEPEHASPEVASAAWQKLPEGLQAVAVTKGDKLQAVKQSQPIAGEDPYAAFWKEIPFVEVPLLAQQAAMPGLAQGTIAAVKVQAAHDGKLLAVRCEWQDASVNGFVDSGRFPDAVALELPLKEGAPPMMGSKEAPVQLMHWKAIWQKDVDVGYQDVQDIHPNFWSDLYWFAEPGHPHPIGTAFKNPESLRWLVAMAAGNPLAVLQKSTAAEEAIASGWGTLTHQPNSATKARGLWAAGRWAVVFTRPLKTDDAADAQLTPGNSTQIAFAVWDGGKGQVGGRKHWASWVDMAVAP